MKLGVVIPATYGREDNLELVLASLRQQGYPETPVVVVDDGGGLRWPPNDAVLDVDVMRVPKHQPGMEQPRNLGVRLLASKFPDVTHVHFLDSDVVLEQGAHAEILDALSQDSDRVLVCPYDWLAPGIRPDGGWPEFWANATVERNDPRWAMFYASPVDRVYRSDLSAGLACFSGNLVWPVDRFQHVGGFWSEIHHGRCEDGELGLRAVAMEVPISFVAAARGFHLAHPVNTNMALERNARDVPMLNERHPWVERGAVFLTDRDGAAFDVRCGCGEVVHTIQWWEHAAACERTGMELPV